MISHRPFYLSRLYKRYERSKNKAETYEKAECAIST